jgi:hypothetical protein
MLDQSPSGDRNESLGQRMPKSLAASRTEDQRRNGTRRMHQ